MDLSVGQRAVIKSDFVDGAIEGVVEIAPARTRGSLVSVNQLMIVIGISAAFFSNYFLLPLGAQSWRWMLGIQVFPAAGYFLLLLLVPESPRWLLSKAREQGARDVLAMVHGSAAAERELQEIRASLGKQTRRFALRELLTGRLPFVGPSSMDLMLAHATEKPPAFAELEMVQVCPAVEGVIFSCLEKDPQSCSDGCKGSIGATGPILGTASR